MANRENDSLYTYVQFYSQLFPSGVPDGTTIETTIDTEYSNNGLILIPTICFTAVNFPTASLSISNIQESANETDGFVDISSKKLIGTYAESGNTNDNLSPKPYLNNIGVFSNLRYLKVTMTMTNPISAGDSVLALDGIIDVNINPAEVEALNS